MKSSSLPVLKLIVRTGKAASFGSGTASGQRAGTSFLNGCDISVHGSSWRSWLVWAAIFLHYAHFTNLGPEEGTFVQ